ncbi:MAG: winged helix-turn-helix transcriptional regulator [Candidatus Nanohaloarchaea archaeon]
MEEEELYRLKAFIDRSPTRRKIIELLYKEGEALRPTDIASEIKVQRETVSRRITDLKEEELVEIMNPEDNRNRYYRIAEKGKELWQEFS